MYEIAAPVSRWRSDGLDPLVAQVVATRGFSSRDPGSAAAWLPGEPAVGRLIDGLDVAALGSSAGVLDVTISEDDAVRAGLACGGVATVLVQSASAYPSTLWELLADRAPVALVSTVEHSGAAETEMFTPDTIRSVRERGPHGEQIARQFGRGVSATAILDDPRTAVVTLWPVTTLVVVGDGLIADALTDTANLLGWQSVVTPSVGAAVAQADGLHRSDAVVVLSHSRDVDGPALAAALRGGAGYVGALGSRHTQAARREWLTAHDIGSDEQARIHGPAGLDIDAHTPAEISISIVAEILAARAGSAGGALRERGGPVHVAGVPAPPPRY